MVLARKRRARVRSIGQIPSFQGICENEDGLVSFPLSDGLRTYVGEGKGNYEKACTCLRKNRRKK